MTSSTRLYHGLRFVLPLAMLQTQVTPLSAADIPPSAASLPAMLVGCRAIAVPIGDAAAAPDTGSAATTYERERSAWMAAVQGSSVTRAGPLFVMMSIPPADYAKDTYPAEICGRVDKRATLSGMSFKTLAGKAGYAGYCPTRDPEACLAAVYVALGFTDKLPWPRLPLYALWRDGVAAPKDAVAVIQYLTSTPFDVTEPSADEGTGRPFDIDNIQGCQSEDCARLPEVAEVIDGRGIGWFLELSEAEKP